MNNYLLGGMLIAMIGFSTSALGATIYTDRTTWEAAIISNIFTEDFNSTSGAFPAVITNGDIVDLPNGLTIEGSGAGGLAFIRRGNTTNFDTTHLETDFESINTKLLFSFSGPINAIGFDYAQASSPNSIWIEGIDNISFSPIPNLSNFDISFFGLMSESFFTEISFATAANDQDYKIDNFSYVAPVPIPASIWLFFSGLTFMVDFKRRFIC